jgi:glucoside 3-dehydrogenase (cytochrome c) hitch-hiker subunit
VIARRELLRRLSLAGFGAATSPAWARALASLASAAEHPHADAPVPAASDWKPSFLSAEQDRLVTALAEAIIPATDTPGATAAFVNRYVDAILQDADKHERDDFVRGLKWVDERCRTLFGGPYLECTPQEQTALLTVISSDDNHAPEDEVGCLFFDEMKVKTIIGYYTSEVGIRDELQDGGPLMFAGLQSCTHPEHGGAAPAPARKTGKRG